MSRRTRVNVIFKIWNPKLHTQFQVLFYILPQNMYVFVAYREWTNFLITREKRCRDQARVPVFYYNCVSWSWLKTRFWNSQTCPWVFQIKTLRLWDSLDDITTRIWLTIFRKVLYRTSEKKERVVIALFKKNEMLIFRTNMGKAFANVQKCKSKN